MSTQFLNQILLIQLMQRNFSCEQTKDKIKISYASQYTIFAKKEFKISQNYIISNWTTKIPRVIHIDEYIAQVAKHNNWCAKIQVGGTLYSRSLVRILQSRIIAVRASWNESLYKHTQLMYNSPRKVYMYENKGMERV